MNVARAIHPRDADRNVLGIIMGIGAIGSNLANLYASAGAAVRTAAAGAETSGASGLATISSLLAETDPDNLMAANYADSSPDRSKYLTAQLQSHQAENKLASKRNALVGVLAAGIMTPSKYTDGVLIKTRAERLVRDAARPGLQEDFEEHLEGSRERVAQGAEDALDAAAGEAWPESAPPPEGDAPAQDAAASPPTGGQAARVDITV